MEYTFVVMVEASSNAPKGPRWDADHGVLLLDGAHRLLALPLGALEALWESAGEARTAAFGRAVGALLSRRAMAFLASSSHEDCMDRSLADIEEVLRVSFGVLGLGRISLQTHGPLLLLAVQSGESISVHLLASVAEGLLAGLSGLSLACPVVAQEQQTHYFAVLNEASAHRLRQAMDAHGSFGPRTSPPEGTLP